MRFQPTSPNQQPPDISPINIGNASGSDHEHVGFSDYEGNISHNRLARIDEDPPIQPAIHEDPEEELIH